MFCIGGFVELELQIPNLQNQNKQLHNKFWICGFLFKRWNFSLVNPLQNDLIMAMETDLKRSASEAGLDEFDEEEENGITNARNRFKAMEEEKQKMARQCPYLDTIDRNVLDFDFEKLCSVSLSRINVYACLVCGKYFQGRGSNTHASVHSVNEQHRVFLNLATKKFYCLPDNYEIIDPSLSDIIYVLDPQYSQDLINKLESSGKEVRAFCGSMYLPGIVGLNNIKANDYCNVILQSLSQVSPIR